MLDQLSVSATSLRCLVEFLRNDRGISISKRAPLASPTALTYGGMQRLHWPLKAVYIGYVNLDLSGSGEGRGEKERKGDREGGNEREKGRESKRVREVERVRERETG